MLGAALLLRNYEMKESVTLSDAESEIVEKQQRQDFMNMIFKRKSNNSDEKKVYEDVIEEVSSSTV